MMKPRYKKGDFALVQGQIVEIHDVRIGMSREFDWFRYRVEINKMIVWVNEVDMKPLPNQKAPQVLFGKAQ